MDEDKVINIRCFYCRKMMGWRKGDPIHCQGCTEQAKKESGEIDRFMSRARAKTAAEKAKKGAH